MSKVSIRFLETRVVDDQFAGTARETRFEAGNAYELDARSADRWVRRGAARYLSEADESRALGASNDVSLQIFDGDRDDTQKGAVAGRSEAPSGLSATSPVPVSTADAERITLTDRIAVIGTCSRFGILAAEWDALPAADQLDFLRTFDAELEVHRHEEVERLQALQTTSTAPAASGDDIRDGKWFDGRPVDPVEETTAQDRGLTGSDLASTPAGDVISGLPDTDGDRQGDGTPATGPLSDSPALADFDALTDDQLRDFIEQRDGRRPGPRASRETLISRAKASPSDTAEAE